ncbi:potassium-transporting ATPase subunit KdpA [Dysgonomonas sp. Marseille-P4677]|uniref:potassium-transporting ATPase subunit KdpA n=1 Tax=Dysgonomonas sp. Marseille-P4677 TaxID=2364790 RepID=UPI00191182B8|nr:potassium-transporting ATPase subunit KdpA [Dysgonomonas sp. Marseille-P4677]MBK5722240.1 potassium-transporting ATPase subunit KdpA [Dysgonomonas sp. Marseille-P4677]
MDIKDYTQIFIFLFLLVALTPLLGSYMAKVLKGEKNILTPVFGKFEKYIYSLSGVNIAQTMSWKRYASSLLIFNFVGFIFLFVILLFQNWLPLNPQQVENMNWHTALNTSISFITNTNWQSYSGETGLSYFSQMTGLTVQNFLSAATGIAVLIALTRGIIGRTTDQIGNFWIDITRSILYILLPLSILLAILLAGQGVIQNFESYTEVITLNGGRQTIPQGPAASQIAIKQLGTNGGGFFGTNSAHPFENPTPFSNFLQLLAILIIPAALTYTYGKMVKSTKQGWTIFTVMFILFVVGLAISLYSEFHQSTLWQNISFMEGKETRFGIANSVLWSTATTAASNGSVNAMHDSLTPLSGMVAMINMMLGEVIYGGAGAGLYGIIIFIILTVFIAGLMVGRTPEYLGKKIESFEVKMAMIAVLCPAIVILLFSAIACSIPSGLSSLNNEGPHGLSEILYAFASAAGNNGSVFAGLNVSTPFYNLMIGLGMLIGRFGIIIPVLAIAGSLAQKKTIPVSQGTFRTDNALFIGLLIAVIIIIGGLTFFPALSLAPIVDHILMQNGILF